MDTENKTCYEELPDCKDFEYEFDTWILAFCPDTASWFATNKRFFFYEYPTEFPDENSAIAFFYENSEIFLELVKDMKTYYPSFYEGGVFLENMKELIKPNGERIKYKESTIWEQRQTTSSIKTTITF